jgi:hypothetical protein
LKGVRVSTEKRDGALLFRPEHDEDALTDDTSATELVRDTLDSDQRRKTELTEVAERVKERKACAPEGQRDADGSRGDGGMRGPMGGVREREAPVAS